MRVLILGYGNVDRQDDGVAWHVIHNLLHRLGYAKVEEFEENEPQEFGNVDVLFQLQLVPEFSELIAKYDRVCFIDAHTGSVPDNVHLEDLIPGYQHSPFTHHLTASSLLAMSSSIYHKTPPSILVSVRGYEFGFSQQLSELTASLVPAAVDLILKWLHTINIENGGHV